VNDYERSSAAKVIICGVFFVVSIVGFGTCVLITDNVTAEFAAALFVFVAVAALYTGVMSLLRASLDRYNVTPVAASDDVRAGRVDMSSEAKKSGMTEFTVEGYLAAWVAEPLTDEAFEAELARFIPELWAENA
jgi:hypothetical protein